MIGTRAVIFLAIICVVVVILQGAAASVAGDVACNRILNFNSSVIHGNISSPRYPLPYPTNISCTWIIRSPPKTYIRLVVKKFYIRALSQFCVDHLTVRYAGPSSYRYCYSWGARSRVFHSPNNEMMITFTAGPGNNTAQQGFFAEFKILKAVCSPRTNFTSFVATITSPNYPKNYPGNLTCQWVIQVPQGYRVYLKFYTVALQKSDMCKSDYILVMDGIDPDVHIMKQFCGRNSGYTIFISSGNTLTVLFRSDLLFTNTGFYATYSAIAPYQTTPTPIISSTPTLSKLPTQTVSSTHSLTPRQTLVVSPSKTTNVVPKQSSAILPDNLIGTYQGSYGVAAEVFSYINRIKITSKIACVLKCQQTLQCKAATFSCHGDRGLCTLYGSSPQYKPGKGQPQISGDMYYEHVTDYEKYT